MTMKDEQQPSSKPLFVGDDGPMTAGDCARWLEAKYSRHHEMEDKASADLIRWQAQEIARLTAMLRSAKPTTARRAEIHKSDLEAAFQNWLDQPWNNNYTTRQQFWLAFKAGADWAIAEMRKQVMPQPAPSPPPIT